jgi:hypothetical protein
MSTIGNHISRWDLQRNQYPLKSLSSSSKKFNIGGGASENLVSLYADSLTGSGGDGRVVYARIYFGDGGGGEAIRAYGTINNATVAVGGTVNGAHISLSATGASAAVSGAAHALRTTLEVADSATNIGGTVDVVQVDTSFSATPTIPAKTSFIRVDNLGAGKLNYLLGVTNPSTTMFADAGTGASSAGVSTGGVAAKVLKVDVGGTDYWLPLFSSNA